MASLYDMLGVRPDADVREIRTAYLRLAKRYHPDKNFGNEVAGQQFNDAKAAYEFLRDDENRKRYDVYLENIRRRSRQLMRRHGFIYGFGFVATFCAVFVGVRYQLPNRLFEPVVALPSFQNRDSQALARRESSATKAGQASAQHFDPNRYDPVVPPPQVQAMATSAPDQIQYVRPPPLQTSPPPPRPRRSPTPSGRLWMAVP